MNMNDNERSLLAENDALRTRIEDLEGALEEIEGFEAEEPLDEWSEAAAFIGCQEIARAALSKETTNTRSTVFKHPDGWMPGDPE